MALRIIGSREQEMVCAKMTVRRGEAGVVDKAF